ncbi:MAG: hypothetical protein KDD38_08235 [Bdellovibrionales bacterium]|nr:hypothetical protein [Bdellovibrionales bacterium]
MLNKLSLLFILITFSLTAFSAEEKKYSLKRQINLELEEVEGASSYEIELQSKNLKKPQTFKMTTPAWKAAIRPAEYQLRMRSYDSRGVPGPWSESIPFLVKLPGPDLHSPQMNAQIKTDEEKTYKVTLKWQEVPGTKKYRVDIISTVSGNKTSETFSDNSGEVKLSVADQYTWTVTPISKSNEEGEAQDTPGAFSLIGKKIETPKINKPEDIWPEKITWDKSEYADSYTFSLQRQNEKGSWERVEAQQKFTSNEVRILETYPGGKYKFVVKAEGQLREDSGVAKIEFDVFVGDRSPAAVEESKLRYSLEKPTDWYFIASYLVTMVNYTGTHGSDGNRSIFYNAPGGTGRLGLGYTDPNTSRGYLGILDLTGVTLAGQNVTWASAEGHYIWRKTWGRNLFRPSAGIFYKELVETTDTGGDKNFSHEKITYMGPHVGFDFWRPLTYRLGWQINARVYYGLLGMSSPNGKKPEAQLSYQMGIMGSYRIQQNIMGFMGWAHRFDHASYEANSSLVPGSGAKQDAQVAGDFFNLLLEWGF